MLVLLLTPHPNPHPHPNPNPNSKSVCVCPLPLVHTYIHTYLRTYLRGGGCGGTSGYELLGGGHTNTHLDQSSIERRGDKKRGGERVWYCKGNLVLHQTDYLSLFYGRIYKHMFYFCPCSVSPLSSLSHLISSLLRQSQDKNAVVGE